jgi:hypothetical protein
MAACHIAPRDLDAGIYRNADFCYSNCILPIVCCLYNTKGIELRARLVATLQPSPLVHVQHR